MPAHSTWPSPCPVRIRNPGAATRFSPIKAKTPAIVHDQGKSRHTPKYRGIPVPGRSHHQTCPPHQYHKQLRPPCLPEYQNPGAILDSLPLSRHYQASIKAKTLAIVHNQGISRQPPFLSNDHPIPVLPFQIAVELAYGWFIGTKRQRTGRTPRRPAHARAVTIAPASWSAAALRRFSAPGLTMPMLTEAVIPASSHEYFVSPKIEIKSPTR